MAITISGENNNDKILATDGVIDEISGINIVGLLTAGHLNVGSNIQLGNAGIITATTFNGNLNGNVNSTSPLLLQTGGSERFRITGNNELGIAGANYGTSGQVLTSGGSGSAVSWATPAVTSFTSGANNRVVTATSGSGLNGEANLTYNGSSQLKLSGTGQQDFIIGSTNAGGTYLILDGDSNGDAIGSDYAYIAHDTGGDVIIGGDNPSGNADIIIKAGNNSEKVRITSGGQLLVGNFTSGNSNNLIHARLANGSIASNSTASVILAENSANTWITIGSGASNYGGILFADSGSSDIGQVRYNHSTNALEFLTNGGNTSNIRLLITSDGKVGINQSTPTEDLEVKGDQTATIFINSGQHDASTAQEATLKLGFNQSHANDSIGYVKLIEGGGNAFDGDLTFGVPYNNSGTPTTREALRIKWNGKIGIGTDSVGGKLDIHSSSAGSVNPDGDADELVLESSDKTGMSILSPGSGESSIYFGNPGTNGQKDGWLKYYHETHSNTAKRRALQIKAGGGEVAYFNSTGLVMSNDKGLSFINADDIATGETVGSSVITDYEEGTWTPTNSLGLTLTVNNTAHYIKVGRLVTVWFDVSLTGHPDSAQCSAIQSLPYTSEDSDNFYGQSNSVWYSETNAATRDHDDSNTLIYVNKDSTTINLWNVTGGHNHVRAWAVHSSTQGRRFRGTVSYKSKY